MPKMCDIIQDDSFRAVGDKKKNGVVISAMTSLLEITEHSQRQKCYIIEPAPRPHKPLFFVAKRLFDIVASFFAGIILLIPMLVIAAMIKLDSRGPVIYKQERLGKDGKPFVMYKFRSMHVDAENKGPQWANKVDWRCTRMGRVIRRTRLDELPQLWNILKGDMSFVGPRPERAFFYDQFETYIHGFRNRLVVQPGLTGLAQVNGGYDLGPEEKIVYDMEYIRAMSIKMDLHCLLKTARLIFTHEGAR